MMEEYTKGSISEINKTLVEEMIIKVTEDYEKFVFETIGPFCDNVVKRVVSKKDLEQALIQYFSKEPQGHWIPLTRENEPIPYKHYLFTTNDGYVVLEHWGGQFSKYTAYMELPEPYSAEMEGKE